MNSIANLRKLPLTFVYGGKTVCGIPAEWNPVAAVRRIDSNITDTTVTGTSPDGLEVRIEMRNYHDFEVLEYGAYLTNRGSSDTPVIENARINCELPIADALLYHGNGDTCHEDGYEWETTSIGVETLTLAPCGDGTSCNGAFPYMRLYDGRGGVNIAVGWTGTWIAEFKKTENGVALSIGQKRCHMVIKPGETIRVPSLTLVYYKGNDDSGRNTWRKWYFAHVMPKQDGKLLPPKCCMHLFGAEGKPEFTGATEQNQLDAIEGYLKNGIRPDVWWIDAGWYPCDFKWFNIGSWYANPEHFPNGLSPIGDKCAENKMELLLWFEPERAFAGSEFDIKHPEWLLHWHKDGVDDNSRAVNMGDPACCDYVIDMVDALIKQFGVKIYRQDCNFNPARCWEEAETPDRVGAVENLCIQGYYRYWDALLARNPGLLIDSCAGGGRRNDIETMKRSVPFHYTDVGYGNHPIKLKQHRQMFEWMPYFRAHNQNWCKEDGSYDKTSREPDRYSYYVAMTPALTDITEYNASAEAFALAREMQSIWRKAAARMIGTDYYPLTECRKSTDDFYAAQFNDPEKEAGILHMVNGSTAQETRFILRFKGLCAEHKYMLTSAETKRVWTLTGAELMNGIKTELAKKSGDVIFYERV